MVHWCIFTAMYTFWQEWSLGEEDAQIQAFQVCILGSAWACLGSKELYVTVGTWRKLRFAQIVPYRPTKVLNVQLNSVQIVKIHRDMWRLMAMGVCGTKTMKIQAVPFTVPHLVALALKAQVL